MVLVSTKATRNTLEFREHVHVSQQNTFTGKLTPAMLRDVLGRAKELAGKGERGELSGRLSTVAVPRSGSGSSNALR